MKSYLLAITAIAVTLPFICLSQNSLDPSCSQIISEIPTSGENRAIVVSGNYAYVLSSGIDTMDIVDISDPINPSIISSVGTGDSPSALAVSGNHVYVVNYFGNTMDVFDVSNPLAPSLVSNVPTRNQSRAISVINNYVYIINDGTAVDSLLQYDISSPALPSSPYAISLNGTPISLAAGPDHLYIGYSSTSGSDDVDIVNISNQTAPYIESSFVTGLSGHSDMEINGNVWYITDGYGLFLFDITIAISPAPIGSTPSGTVGNGMGSIEVAGDYVVGNHRFTNVIKIFDVIEPSTPSLVLNVPAGEDPEQIVVIGPRVFVANSTNSVNNLTILNLFCPSDSICNAVNLDLGTNGPFDVTGALVEAGDPLPPIGTGGDGGCWSQDGWCGVPPEPVLDNTTWYTFVAPQSGSITLNSDNSTFDTQLAVYSGSCTEILAGSGLFLGGNDDNNNGPNVDFTSELSLDCLTPGETYYLLVDGYNGDEGDLMVELTENPNPIVFGTYPNTTVTAGQNTTVAPSAAPNGATSLNAFADAGFTGLLTADPVTGVVSVTDALQAGIYTVTVNANGGCGTSSFTLTVTDPICSAEFTNASDVVASNSRQIKIGDFNNDGVQDLAALQYSPGQPGSIFILLGDGAGGFVSSGDITTDNETAAFNVGDFNGDGNQDLVSANLFLNQETLTVHLGDGTGGFSSTAANALGGNPFSIAVGDLNNDGNLDLALTLRDDDNAEILLGDGTGGFTNSGVASVGDSPSRIVLNDFNADGHLDLATSNWNSDNLSIRLGDGTGGFSGATDLTVGDTPYGLASSDLNGDGFPDLAVANTEDDNVSILLGDGIGGFTNAGNISVSNRPYTVAIGDLNGDGVLDLAVPNLFSAIISIRLGDGAGGFSNASNVNTGNQPTDLAIGDFNLDGTLDLAISNLQESFASIRLGEVISITGANQVDVGSSITLTGNGTPAAVDPWVSSNTGVATVDANGEVTGVAAGTVDITYTTESGCSDLLSITVNGAGPANDSICNAIVLSFGTNGPWDITGAGAEAGEPIVPEGTGTTSSCQSQDGWCNAANGGGVEPIITNSVWYTFVAPASGNVTINTETSTYDTQIAVYSGNDCNDILAGNGTLEGANDDISGSIFQSEVHVTCLTPGETYFVLVDGWLGDEGDLVIEMTDNLYLVDATIAGNNLLCDGGPPLVAPAGADFTYLWTPGNETTQSINVSTTGIYEVLVTDSNGCTATDDFEITEALVTPTAAFSSVANFLTVGFTDNSIVTSPTSYTWDFGDNSGSSDENPQHTYAASGTYNVCLFLTSPCGDDQICQDVTVDLVTGIEESGSESLLLYPNPSDGQFTIELIGLEGPGTLNVIDMAGKVVYSESMNLTSSFKRSFDLDIATGTYALQIQNANQLITRKLEFR